MAPPSSSESRKVRQRRAKAVSSTYRLITIVIKPFRMKVEVVTFSIDAVGLHCNKSRIKTACVLMITCPAKFPEITPAIERQADLWYTANN